MSSNSAFAVPTAALSEVLRGVRAHARQHRTATIPSDDQRKLCLNTAKELRKNLQKLTTTKFEDEALSRLVMELIETVIEGEFCPHSYSVFGKADSEDFPLACAYMASFIATVCDSNVSSTIRDNSFRIISFLGTIISKQDAERFLLIFSDLVALIERMSSEKSVEFVGFERSLMKRGGRVMHFDVSTSAKRTGTITALISILNLFAQVDLSAVSSVLGIAMEKVCQALESCCVKANHDEEVAESWLKTLNSLNKVPSSRIYLCSALLGHLVQGAPQVWSAAYSGTAATVARNLFFGGDNEVSMQSGSNLGHVWAIHVASRVLELVDSVALVNRKELRELRVVALDLLTMVLRAKPEIAADCDTQLFSPTRTFVTDHHCTIALCRLLVCALSLSPSGMHPLLAHVRRRAGVQHIASQDSQLQKRVKLMEMGKSAMNGARELAEAWVSSVAENLEECGLGICLHALGEMLKDAALSKERHYILQIASDRVERLIASPQGFPEASTLLSIISVTFRSEQLRAFPAFQETMARLLAEERRPSLSFLEAALSSSSAVITRDMSMRVLASLTPGMDSRLRAICSALFKRDADLVAIWVQSLLQETLPLKEDAQLEASTMAKWVWLKQVLHPQEDLDTSVLVSCIPQLVDLMSTEEVPRDFRICLIQIFSLIVRRSNAPEVMFQEQSISTFLLMLTDEDVAVRNQIAREIGCLLSGLGVIGNGAGMKALGALFRHESDSENVKCLLSHLGDLLEKNENKAYRRVTLLAVGSVGSAARSTSRENDVLFLLLVQWSLHALASQWAKVDDTAQTVVERTTALEQLRRIAFEQGLRWIGSETTYTSMDSTDDWSNKNGFGSRQQASSGIIHPAAGPAIRRLFEMVKEGLYKKLFVTLSQGSDFRTTLSCFAADVFGDASEGRVERLLNDVFPVVLPAYLTSVETHGDVLKKLAGIMYPNKGTEGLKTMLIENYKAWIPLVVELLDNSGPNQGDVRRARLQKIQSLIAPEVTINQLLRIGVKPVLRKIVLDITDNRAQKQLEALARHVKSGDNTPPVGVSPTQLFVREEFMYMMNILSETIQEKHEGSPGPPKDHALKCVGTLLQLLDSPVDEFVPKVMPTLVTAMQDPHLQSYARRALEILASKLSPQAQFKNLSGFVVTLLPCLMNKTPLTTKRISHSSSSMGPTSTSAVSSSRSQSNALTSEEACARLILKLVERLPQEPLEDYRCALEEVKELIPDHPALVEVSTFLVHKLGVRGPLDRIERLSSLITRDSDDMRLLALRELHSILQQRSGDLMALVLNRQTMLISRLMGSLLRTARSVGARLDESSTAQSTLEEISHKCCECLGEIGAIDPALLNVDRLDHGRDFVDPCDPATEMDMGNLRLTAVLLRRFLIDALRTAPDPMTHMKVGYCVQELRGFLGPLLATVDEKKDAQMLGDEAVASTAAAALEEDRKEIAWLIESKSIEVLRPFEKTNYIISEREPIVRQGRGGQTFFGSEVSFASSLGEWVAYLATIAQQGQSKVFAPLVVLKQSDCATRMMLFVLPYVVQNVICCGTRDQVNEIRDEIVAILDDAVQGAKSEMMTEDQYQGSGGRIQLSVQAVFFLLDTLNRWVTQCAFMQTRRAVNRNSLMRAMAKYKGEFEDKTMVSVFLQSIPKRRMAEAAYRCGSSSRALFYLETELRSLHPHDEGGGGVGGPGSWRMDQTVQFERDEIELLHMIHSGMEQDPDGLRGVVVLRTRHDGGPGTGYILNRYRIKEAESSPETTTIEVVDGVSERTRATQAQPRLMEQIHELESEARWDEALSCYEEALSRHEDGSLKNVDEAGLHEGQLRCLWRAGHLQLLVSVSDGKLARNPRLRPIVIPYALDALWRLGKWPELKAVLDSLDIPSNESSSGLRLMRKGAPGGISGDYIESLSAAILAAAEKRDFRPFVKRARMRILELLSAASMESYERAHPLLHRLQGLVEMERGLCQNAQPDEKWWADRLKGTSPGLALRAELLAIRRAVNRISGYERGATARLSLEADSWLSLAKTAREFGDGAACESALIMLRRTLGACSKEEETVAWSSSWRSRIQRAELFRTKGALFDALKVLEPETELLQVDSDCPKTLANSRAKALLLATNIVAETGSSQGKAVLERYEKVLHWRPHWEKGTYYLAKYCDYLFERIPDNPEAKQKGLGAYRNSLLVKVLQAYGETLRLGSKHLFEVLPRILTLWYSEADRAFEEGTSASGGGGEKNSDSLRGNPSSGQKTPQQQQGSADQSKKKSIQGRSSSSSTTTTTTTPSSASASSSSTAGPTPNRVVEELKDVLSPAVWYTALAQLMSRIGHQDPEVWRITRDIVARIVAHFPSRALWFVMGVSHSKVQARRPKATDILNKFTINGVESIPSRSSLDERQKLAQRYVNWSYYLLEGLIQLAKSTQTTISVKTMFANIEKLRDNSYGLVMPTLSYLKATSDTDRSTAAPLFGVIDGHVDVMASKEKPKKIKVKGTDGVNRNFLCKCEGKGDLRKDSRLMDFNTVVNELFNRDVQARRRRLRLRTYAVVCLNEECGLLEWVENTQGFRVKLIEIYSQDVKPPASLSHARNLLQTIQEELKDPDKKDRRIARYRDEVLSLFPPRFHKFFLQRFRDPSEWLAARMEFTRSAAVWSMVGHVLGLGDRHAENLLLDMTTGECVHVDFDCLFDKGLTLAKPEIVPFRLTRNMVDGMGLTGVEGAFRGSCEVSLSVLRENKTILLSVLESFVVDPLVEWSKARRGDTGSPENADEAVTAEEQSRRQKELAREKFDGIAERLSGIVRDREVLAQQAKNHRISMAGGNKPVTRRSLTRTTTIQPLPQTAEESLTVADTFEALPVSVQGQVERLIKEAIDEDKLSRMFIGWCPFL